MTAPTVTGPSAALTAPTPEQRSQSAPGIRIELDRSAGRLRECPDAWHGYDDVDLVIVRDVLQNRLGDLERFASTVRLRLEA